ncbi:hypothetical protein [Ruegeria sp. AD91A]|uniref:hypothetical protein n=1 Tax=Ruegeria sp. AD91A TaxID=2293862 RepID=UPI0013C316C2|nr:hypothetical protein [Ruegeria sp. AD91A]
MTETVLYVRVFFAGLLLDFFAGCFPKSCWTSFLNSRPNSPTETRRTFWFPPVPVLDFFAFAACCFLDPALFCEADALPLELFFPPPLAWEPFEEFPFPLDPLDPLLLPLSAFPEFPLPFPLSFFAKAASGASAKVAAAATATLSDVAVATDARRFRKLWLAISPPQL